MYKVVTPDTYKTILLRPHETDSIDQWFLPCYSIENSENRNLINNELLNNEFINIAIIGLCGEYDASNTLVYYNYNVNFLNRLKTDKKIKLHVIARNITCFQFYGLKRSIELHTYQNIQTEHMFNVLPLFTFQTPTFI